MEGQRKLKGRKHLCPESPFFTEHFNFQQQETKMLKEKEMSGKQIFAAAPHALADTSARSPSPGHVCCQYGQRLDRASQDYRKIFRALLEEADQIPHRQNHSEVSVQQQMQTL